MWIALVCCSPQKHGPNHTTVAGPPRRAQTTPHSSEILQVTLAAHALQAEKHICTIKRTFAGQSNCIYTADNAFAENKVSFQDEHASLQDKRASLQASKCTNHCKTIMCSTKAEMLS
jgi:hypothetical protein